MDTTQGLYAKRYGVLPIKLIIAGEVVHADILQLPNGMSKGCGIVEYATASEAQNAIADLSNQTLLGRMVYIREVELILSHH